MHSAMERKTAVLPAFVLWHSEILKSQSVHNNFFSVCEVGICINCYQFGNGMAL